MCDHAVPNYVPSTILTSAYSGADPGGGGGGGGGLGV